MKKKIDSILAKTKLILSGGGIKGISHIGAMQALADYGNINSITTIAGTSVGAVMGCLFVIGYSPKELYDFTMMFDLTKMGNISLDGITNKHGLDDGNKIIFVLGQMFENLGLKQEITFKELFEKTKKTFIVTSSCMNDKKCHYFSHVLSPNMSVLKAIRMSMSIPIYFTPVKYEEKTYIDGGCIDNYPIQLFQDELDSVIGFYLADNFEYIQEIDNIESVIVNIWSCMMAGITANSLKGYEKYSVKISVENLGMMNLGLDKNKKQMLYECGYKAFVDKFVNSQ